MILVLSGEGASDIGGLLDANFRPGPMAMFIDKFLEPIANYSLLRAQALEFISEGDLARHSKKLPMAISIGKKRDYETAYFFKNARALARQANKRAREQRCPIGVVLFRDADSTQRRVYESKWKSIAGGFLAEDFAHGVPMVPKPKSEAWLLCALKPQAYQNCADLEDSLSGNDNSPNPAKEQLERILTDQNKTISNLPEMVVDGTIVPGRIEMPSFQRFRARLEDVARSLLGLSHHAS
jgi:hypothetical protein